MRNRVTQVRRGPWKEAGLGVGAGFNSSFRYRALDKILFEIEDLIDTQVKLLVQWDEE